MPIIDTGNPNAAIIRLAFASFVENNNPPPTSGAPAGPFCQTTSLEFLMLDAQLVNASGQVTIVGTKVSVKRNTRGNGNQPIQIAFVILPPLGGVIYNGKAIVFNQRNGSDDGNGEKNFPGANRDPKDGGIVISNKMSSRGSGSAAPRWDFYIRIQQSGGESPPFGWIDPDIENDL